MVDAIELDFGLKAVSSGGFVLNSDELLGLQAGLMLLQSKQRHDSIYFWGKILGQEMDYYIAFGLRDVDFEFPSKVFYYARHDYQFQALQRLTEEQADQILEMGIELPFTGIPDSPLQSLEANVGQGASLCEVHRLAQIVQEIDFDTAAVPAGAYALYVHFRPPTSVQALRAIAKTDV
eukprot:5676514-Amphidinium_carterae.1